MVPRLPTPEEIARGRVRYQERIAGILYTPVEELKGLQKNMQRWELAMLKYIGDPLGPIRREIISLDYRIIGRQRRMAPSLVERVGELFNLRATPDNLANLPREDLVRIRASLANTARKLGITVRRGI